MGIVVNVCNISSCWMESVCFRGKNISKLEVNVSIFDFLITTTMKIYLKTISFQAYFIGCTFDSFSQSWHDRSYVLTLLVTAWLVPLFMIFLSDLGILHRIRTTNINITIERSKSLASTDSSKQDYRIDNGLNTLERKRNLPHDAKRVIKIVSILTLKNFEQFKKYLKIDCRDT